MLQKLFVLVKLARRTNRREMIDHWRVVDKVEVDIVRKPHVLLFGMDPIDAYTADIHWEWNGRYVNSVLKSGTGELRVRWALGLLECLSRLRMGVTTSCGFVFRGVAMF